ncbi:extracellular solute-binding protein [Streptomyces sp. AS02]|uniref:extracellular solute-binding protein n=1 Tax=Streptomyces sp. AS02 TaxID=2938946 RepID=UPI002021E914|nr:extracellular solute-binding protein [Streptomyces sp. AS02]MCL8011355.1 extracellular solute-binding protein [Streptomyces sp. AS02]
MPSTVGKPDIASVRNGNTYATSLATLSASGDLPDWVQIPSFMNGQAQTGGLVGRHLADLTPYLSGDNAKEYPNLAAIPSGGWMSCAWENKHYGIPCLTSGTSFNQVVFYRQDVFQDRGIDAADIKSADDLMRVGRERTDAKAGHWAFDDIWTYFSGAFGVPPKYRVDGGKLVHKYRTPEILEALAWHHKLAKSGLMNPDALAGNANKKYRRGLLPVDGAGEWRVLWSVVLPTSRAVTAVVTLFYAVGYWNSFFNVMLYMPLDSREWLLQYVLYQYVSLGFNMPGQTNSGFGEGKSLIAPLSLQMAVVVLTLLPVVVAFPFLQPHLAKGMLTGAIKG